MKVAWSWRQHFQFRIDRILGSIDADRPHVAARKFPVLAGAARPDRARRTNWPCFVA
jgi:hypothetical protein